MSLSNIINVGELSIFNIDNNNNNNSSRCFYLDLSGIIYVPLRLETYDNFNNPYDDDNNDGDDYDHGDIDDDDNNDDDDYDGDDIDEDDNNNGEETKQRLQKETTHSCYGHILHKQLFGEINFLPFNLI